MDGKDKGEPAAEPPGEGDSLKDASDEAVRQMEEQPEGAGHAGYGDGG